MTRPNETSAPARSRLPWLITGALAVLAVVLFVQNSVVRQTNLSLHTERELARIASETIQAQLNERTVVAESIITELGRRLRRQEDMGRLRVFALRPTDNTDAIGAIVVWDLDQQAGLLSVIDLQPPPADREYQLWIAGAGGADSVSAGVFSVAPGSPGAVTFRPARAVDQAPVFGVSLEARGGALRPSGALLLRSQ